MNTDKKPVTLLFNPFVYIAGMQALGVGLAAILLAGFLGSLTDAHFDGVLDLHVGAKVPLWVFLAEGLIDWLCLAMVLLLAGRIISRTSFRTIDLVGTQALARWPTVFMPLLVMPAAFHQFTKQLLEQLRQGGRVQINAVDTIVFLALTVGLLVLLCWMVALMYKSFSVSCNVRGGKAIGTFITGLLVAEILSKLCLAPLLLRYLEESAVKS